MTLAATGFLYWLTRHLSASGLPTTCIAGSLGTPCPSYPHISSSGEIQAPARIQTPSGPQRGAAVCSAWSKACHIILLMLIIQIQAWWNNNSVRIKCTLSWSLLHSEPWRGDRGIFGRVCFGTVHYPNFIWVFNKIIRNLKKKLGKTLRKLKQEMWV